MKILYAFLMVLLFSLFSGCSSDELAKKDKALSDLSAQNTELKMQNKELENQIKLKDQEIGFLKEKLEQANKDLEALKARLKELEALETRYAVLEAEKKSGDERYQERVKNLEAENALKAQAVEEKTAEVQKLQDELKKITEDQAKLKEEMEKQKQELEQLKKQLAEKPKDPAQEIRVKDMETQLAGFQEQAVSKDKELQELREQVKELKQYQDMLQQETDRLKQEFSREIKNGDMVVEQSLKTINVIMMEKVLFRKSEISLTPEGEKVLRKVANVLKGVKDKEIFVIGHADSDPVTDPIIKKIFPTNWEFSVMRAVMVVRYLTEILNADPALFTAAGRSFYHPMSQGKTEKEKSMNRRTEILIFPKIEQIKKEELKIDFEEKGQQGAEAKKS